MLIKKGKIMNDKPENPSAFPLSLPHGLDEPILGMSLRDYFAAKAMQGFVLNPEYTHLDNEDYDATAKDSYLIADAMLKERAKQ